MSHNLTIYNTLSRKKEEFKPLDAKNVRMYVCGPTVYDFAHVGNARPVVVFDTLFRLLRRVYGDDHVTYVRNITDVDDKIMTKAKESGEAIETITTRTTKAYHDDMNALNALRPTAEPRATQHIGEMIKMIEGLIAKGHAYVHEDTVYPSNHPVMHVLFRVQSCPSYGELSRRSLEERLAGARIDVAPYKEDPADFVLWKPSTPEQVGWDSPWGRGRPGWHIECSAMAEKTLGPTFDIHGGGLDLIFPHHENEIAQSRCAHNDAPLANYWMHNGFLEINKDKMSKSLGNFFTVRQLLDKYHGEVIRLALLSAHYRQPLDFSDDLLINSKKTLDRWYGSLSLATLDQPHSYNLTNSAQTSIEIDNALSDDLNTPEAISQIHKLVDELFLGIANADHQKIVPPIRAKLLIAGQALGLLQQDPKAWFKWQPAGKVGLSDAEIETQIEARKTAKANKNFAESDRIRDALAAQGVILEDKPGGVTEWRRK